MGNQAVVDILSLPAGRELDALVAEKVMGCHVLLTQTGSLCGCPGWPHSDGEGEGDIKSYSSSIAAAWEVVEVFDTASIERLWDGELFRWRVEFTRFQPEAFAVVTADTAPLAICRAALKAVTA